jgi:hypothetical protein
MRPLLAALLVLSACSSSSTAPDAGGSPPGDLRSDLLPDLVLVPDVTPDTTPCKLIKPYSSKDADCNQCAEEKCCPEINGCLGDPECDDEYVTCILACALTPVPDAGVDACLQQCATDYPTGKAEYDVAIGCADAKCATECQ